MVDAPTACNVEKVVQVNNSTGVLSNNESLLYDQHILTTNSYITKEPLDKTRMSVNNRKLDSLTTSLPYILKPDDDFVKSCLNLVYNQASPEDTQDTGSTLTKSHHSSNSTKPVANNELLIKQDTTTPPSSPEDNMLISPPPSAKSLTAEFNTFAIGQINKSTPTIKRHQDPPMQESRRISLATTNSTGLIKDARLGPQERDLPPLPQPHHYQHQQLPPLPQHHYHQQQLPPLPEDQHIHDTSKSNSSNSLDCLPSSCSFTATGTSGEAAALDTPAKDFVDPVDNGTSQQQPSPSPALHIDTNRTINNNDSNYYPDSSLLAASLTEPAPHPLSLTPHHPQFPPITLDSLNNFCREAQASPHDLALQLNFAKYLMEAVQQVHIDDVSRSTKAKTAMLLEAQRIVKTLAMQSRIGRSGYAEAQFYLANAYGAGLMLLDVSHEKAFHLYLQGSKQSHPACTYRAGVCYELGLGTKRDNARAIRFYRKAANLGDPSAMYKLAMILLWGLLDQTKHPKEAISWLKRAAPLADAYHPEILHELGLVYENDNIPSVIPDQDYTRELVTKAARFGYAPSQYKLGIAYENGLWHCPIDARRSIAWYTKAAEQGHMESALALSGWYLTGALGSDGVELLAQNDMQAYLWARKVADVGYAKGQYACGYYAEMGIGVGQNMAEALHWYELAAQQKYAKAINRLADLKLSNTNIKQQRKKQQQRLSLQSSRSYLAKTEDGQRRNSTLNLSSKSADQQLSQGCRQTTPQAFKMTRTGPSTRNIGSCQIM
ncbi:hypothetical protein BC941DRAFT_421238 [Chlamydoabsidia padenii]|nr:hypothetical protein BC941DRAFT_421238 [Chlamydoabsidia padenii]